jgi:hypothetical protein
MSWLFLAEYHSSGGFLIYELVVSNGIHSSGGFLVPELALPVGIIILLVDSSSMTWQFPAE